VETNKEKTRSFNFTTVNDYVDYLRSRGYSLNDAIEEVRRSYNTKGRVGTLDLTIHIFSALILASLFQPLSFLMVFGMPYTLFFTGYAVFKALYPKGVEMLSRLSLLGVSLGVSFVTLVLIGLVINFTIGFTLVNTVIPIVIITEGFNVINTLRGVREWNIDTTL
jgi:uncharacterized membrane protein